MMVLLLKIDERVAIQFVEVETEYALCNRTAIIFFTNLAVLQAGKRGNGDSIWLKTRRKGRYGGE